jgi:general stress protein 26
MGAKTLKDIATKIANLDIAMLTTQTSNGKFSRPIINNNGHLEYDGNSYYFTHEGSQTVQDITHNPEVSLNFEVPRKLYISVVGTAYLIRQMTTMKQYWAPELEAWLKIGLNTPGVVLVRIQASCIKYWEGEEAGELFLNN